MYKYGRGIIFIVSVLSTSYFTGLTPVYADENSNQGLGKIKANNSLCNIKPNDKNHKPPCENQHPVAAGASHSWKRA